ncbi:YgaP family membrane protein [Clostridium saccharoperbutylacetonicum]
MKNVGSADKAIRFIIGLGLLSSLFVMHGNLKHFGLIGLVPILTATVSFCPLYSLFGIKTCKIEK